MDSSTLPAPSRNRALFVFGLASLLTVALGAVVMAQADVPLGIWIRNPIAWLVAAGASFFLAARGWLGSAMAPVAIIVLALSFLGPDQQGVHRWLDLGLAQFNAAALVLPAVLVTQAHAHPGRLSVYLAAIFILLAFQPDISQLLAFVPAALLIAAPRLRTPTLLLLAIVALLAMALCVVSPDPLAPVPHVEGIFALAWTHAPGLAIAMDASLAAAALSPLLLWKSPAALALAVYFAATALAFLMGAYPVPLAGYGLSYVIGWWLAFACLSVRSPQPVNSLTAA